MQSEEIELNPLIYKANPQRQRERKNVFERERERVMMGWFPYEMIDEVSLHAEKVLNKIGVPPQHLTSFFSLYLSVCNGFII